MKSIWFKPVQVRDTARFSPNTLMETLNIEITEIGPDFLRGRMPVDKRVHQILGMLHGGASLALAETLGSLGAVLTLDETKQFCLGQEINGNHLRAVTSGYVIGTARPFHIGSTSQVWGIDIRDEQDRPVCISRITLAVRDRKA
ncbi:MAG: hotdog fold thioesterase [Rhodospirillaceae bacterium]|nr:hotdog fold thioesterase [Rhodospirillaceae bacterium]